MLRFLFVTVTVATAAIAVVLWAIKPTETAAVTMTLAALQPIAVDLNAEVKITDITYWSGLGDGSYGTRARIIMEWHGPEPSMAEVIERLPDFRNVEIHLRQTEDVLLVPGKERHELWRGSAGREHTVRKAIAAEQP